MKNEQKKVTVGGGYFDNENNEYVITDMFPRRPWLNYLWNEEAMCCCNQFGSGNSWVLSGNEKRMVEDGVRNVYVKDKTSGEVYCANRNYGGLKFERFEARVGLGYHAVVSQYGGVRTELGITMPDNGNLTAFKLTVNNLSDRKKELSLYFCLQPKPDLSWHQAYNFAEYSKKASGLVFHHEGFHLSNPLTLICVGSEKQPVAYETNQSEFTGRYGSLDNPEGLKNEKLSSKNYTWDTYMAVMQFDVTLAPGESFENAFTAFAASDLQSCEKINERFLSVSAFDKIVERQRALNAEYSDVFTLNSPDEYLNAQINVWLKRQISLGKTWGRVYGKGFRDVMQDITAFVSLDAPLAKKRILHALKYQFEDGNPIRMFEPSFYYPYNDGGAWISGAVLAYLTESGDLSLLSEVVPYLKGDSYAKASLADANIFEPYERGAREDTVLEHVLAAIDYLLNSRGEHNLILWRGGDWNDSMNNAGVLGKGESVWLSIATVKAITETQQILKIAGGHGALVEKYEAKKSELKAAIKKHGFNGKHYVYGLSDSGKRVGDKERTYLNTQTWAVLADIDEPAVLNSVMDEIEKTLKCDFGYMQCYPSYYEGEEDLGRVTYFKPGLIENGGVYNHGVAFKIVADCLLGRGNSAYKTLKMISCDNPKNSNSGVEPYAVSNMYIGIENEALKGFAPASWITGTAGWLYRGVTEYICGLRPQENGLTLSPCLPDGWSGTSVTRVFRGNVYNIIYKKSDKNRVVCNGKEVEILPLEKSGTVHEVVCEYIESKN